VGAGGTDATHRSLTVSMEDAAVLSSQLAPILALCRAMSDQRQMYRYVSDCAIQRHPLLKVADDRTTTLHVPLSLRVSGIAKLKSSVCNPAESTRSFWHTPCRLGLKETNRCSVYLQLPVEVQAHVPHTSRCKRGPISHVSRISANCKSIKNIHWRTQCRCVFSLAPVGDTRDIRHKPCSLVSAITTKPSSNNAY
jgi:hypothetical protein